MERAIERLRLAVRELPAVLARLTDAEAAEPQGPGRWSKKEVVGHLIDSASNNHQRFIRGQLQPGQDFPKYEQEGWVRVQQYGAAPWAELIELWRAFNAHLVRVGECMSGVARGSTCCVGGGEAMTLAALFEDYVAHLEHHLTQMFGCWPVA
jgi:hypothetical protein